MNDPIFTTDNNLENCTIDETKITDLQKIANCRIDEIKIDDCPNLLVFPNCLGKYGDKIGEKSIFSISGNELKTGNIMGFVGVNETQINIRSRFAKDEKNDYFLHYMLQKVFSINLFDLKHDQEKDNIFDFLLYLFPYYLNRSLQQGVFKQYQRREYNDSNVKGAINVSRHIQRNIPFNGKIAYTTREHCYDNYLTQLIRHTIEYIKNHQFGNSILTGKQETIDDVSQIVFATESYQKNARQKVISQNLKPLNHPFYYQYRELQQICLQILLHDQLKYGENKDEIYGILFDGAWLWEEYLAIVLKEKGFIHPSNTRCTNPIYLFENNKYPRYPDFWKDKIVLDAKYKHIGNVSIDRDDMHQIITYMYVLKSELGGFIYPFESKKTEINIAELGTLNGYGNVIKTFGIPISQISDNWNGFCSKTMESEKKIRNSLDLHDPQA